MKAKQFGHQTENGKMMFIYQAHQAFTIWHKIIVNIDNKTVNLLNL
jgi:shikimate dehydrogenase